MKKSFHPYAMTAIVCWSVSYTITKLALLHFSVFSLSFLRYFIASAVLVVVAVVTKMKMPEKKDLPWFLVSGAVGFFLYMIAFNTGQGMVSASTASIVIATAPVITALLARFIYREKLHVYQWLAIAIELAGVVVLTLLNGVFSANSGVLWLFVAALCLSFYNLLQRKLTQKYTALQTSAYSIFFGMLLLAVFAPAAFGEVKTAPPIQLFYLLILGVFSSAVAYVVWTIAFTKSPKTSLVSNYMFLTPFLASLLGFILAGEIPDGPTIIGGAIIMVGVVVFNFGGGGTRSKMAPEAADSAAKDAP